MFVYLFRLKGSITHWQASITREWLVVERYPIPHWIVFNPFIPNAPFPYHPKKIVNLTVFWCVQVVEKGCIGNEWYNALLTGVQSTLSFQWTDTAWKVFLLGTFLVRISPHSDWIRRDKEYCSVYSPNAGICVPEKLWIRTLFTQYDFDLKMFILICFDNMSM